MQNIKIGELFWSVDLASGKIDRTQKTKDFIDLSDKDVAVNRTVTMLLGRKKGEHFCVGHSSTLQKARFWNSSKGVQDVIQKSLDKILSNAAGVEGAEEKKALSHFFYHYMNPEGSIGRLSSKVAYNNKRDLFSLDLLVKHVDIVVGKHFWRYSSQTKQFSKALPTFKRGSLIEKIDLSSSEDSINHTIFQLFEKKSRNIGNVNKAVQHLDRTVFGKESEILKLFLQKKSASLRAYKFDRSFVAGGLESFLMPGLKKRREDLINKLVEFDGAFSSPQEECVNIPYTPSDIKSIEAALHSLNFPDKTQIPRIAQEAVKHLKSTSPEDIGKCAKNAYEREKRRLYRMQSVDALKELLDLEAIFAQSIGLEFKQMSDGTGGPRLAYSRQGHPILVIKAEDEGPYGENNPRKWTYFKRLFIKIRNCLAGNSESTAEVSSYLVDKAFGLGIVPPTTIKEVESRAFVGKTKKLCSLQAFVADAHTMQEKLGLKKGLAKWRWSWNQNFVKREKVAVRFEKGFLADRLKEVIPEEKNISFVRALSRLVIHNFLVGDTDCHFDNWMIKEKKITHPTIQSIFGKGKTKREDIEHLVNNLFKDKTHYELLDAFLHDEEDFMIVKPDGGGSFPSKHPKTDWEVRLAYLFEVLPQMKEVFSEEIQSLFKGRNLTFFELVEKIAKMNTETDHNHFRRWLFERDPKEANALQMNIKHPKRVKGIAETMIDRWKVLMHHFSKHEEMRALCQIRKLHDFQKEDAKQPQEWKDKFYESLRTWSRLQQ